LCSGIFDGYAAKKYILKIIVAKKEICYIVIGRINRGYHLSFFYSVISLSQVKSMRGLSLFSNSGLLLPLWFLLLPCRSGGENGGSLWVPQYVYSKR
jgi:hypothetical protein